VSVPRCVAWFSCGSASAVASMLAVEKYGDNCEIVYCDLLSSEHPDNLRFLQDVQRWLGRTVTRIASSDYASVDEVFERTRYMAGINGARCTTEMKKIPRFRFQRPDDIHVFGLTADEEPRIHRMSVNNPELVFDWLLRDKPMTKKACLRMIEQAGIELPTMYKLGYRNNNCIGCVKATSARYWKMIRLDFPEVFERRARQSAAIGARLARERGERVFLHELRTDITLFDGPMESISCGPDCGDVIDPSTRSGGGDK